MELSRGRARWCVSSPIRGFQRVVCGLSLLVVAHAGVVPAADAQVPSDSVAPDTIPADAFQDPGAREMISRARKAYSEGLEGLESWEATVREEISMGLSTQSISRERLLVRSKRVARIRWDAPRRMTLRWLDRQLESVVPRDEEDDDPLLEPDEIFFPMDPSLDRLGLAMGDWVHPLSPEAGRYYRFQSGDTTRIVLPDLDREAVLVEIRFAPRQAAYELLGGSLWFEQESAALVRGAFRPSLPWDLELEEPEEWDGFPGFLKPVLLEADLMVVDYALYELRWWLPHRVWIEGRGRMGSQLEFPFVGAVVASGITLNEAGLDPDFPVPAGWERRTVDLCEEARKEHEELRQRRSRLPEPAVTPEPLDLVAVLCDEPGPAELVVLEPPPGVLDEWRQSAEGRELEGQPPAFEPAELEQLRNSVERTDFPPPPPEPAWLGIVSFRYNRVEGLSGGLRLELPVGTRLRFDGEARIGTADLVPNLEASLVRPLRSGELVASGYWRLAAASDWGNPLGLLPSAHAFLLGYDDGQYYRTAGASIGWRGGRRLRTEARLFAEAQRDAPKETDVSVPYWISGSEFPPNVEADPVEIAGLAGRVRWQTGLDPSRIVLTATAWGEGAVGSVSFGRFAAGGGASIPLFGVLALGLDLSAGSTVGEVPAQRAYFLGGVHTLRAFPNGAVSGTSFWLGRLEVGNSSRSIRLVGFLDIGWAGPRSEFTFDDPALSAGAGISMLDGLVRLDVARSLQGRDPEAWRVYLSFDGVI